MGETGFAHLKNSIHVCVASTGTHTHTHTHTGTYLLALHLCKIKTRSSNRPTITQQAETKNSYAINMKIPLHNSSSGDFSRQSNQFNVQTCIIPSRLFDLKENVPAAFYKPDFPPRGGLLMQACLTCHG